MIEILRAGMLTTVQDAGRRGVGRYGVARAGAMDGHAARLANALAGNRDGAALLECTIAGPRMRALTDCLVSVTGDSPTVLLDDDPVPAGKTFGARSGSIIDVPDTGRGARAYVAVHGGIDVPLVLGSRATDCAAHFGGLDGRPLAKGDVLALGDPDDEAAARYAGARPGRGMLPRYADEPVVRILRGPDLDRAGAEAWDTLTSGAFLVSADSSRMGYRLEGPQLRADEAATMISAPVAPGTVQLPPGGLPIVLMADAQTIGGYPRIASVISVDMPVLAQVRPGRDVRFEEVSILDAYALLAARERDFAMLRTALRLRG